jgi:hypothetical protein
MSLPWTFKKISLIIRIVGFLYIQIIKSNSQNLLILRQTKA